MRTGAGRAVWVALAMLVAWLPARAHEASAQTIVTPGQNLQFGALVPGSPKVILPTNVMNRAVFTLDSRKGSFSVTFLLPAALAAPGGAQVPLLFGPASAQVNHRNQTVTFNPAIGTQVSTNPGHPVATFYLGGEARPLPGQPAGSYTATIVMTVVQTGT